MSKTRIRAVWGTAQSEYIKWICSSRMLIFLCALIFIDQFAVKPLVEISKQTGVKLGLIEPFIAITNSDVLLMIMPIVFITLIGDFPKNDGNMLFCVQRTWRVNWLLGQIAFSCYVFTYIYAWSYTQHVSCGGRLFAMERTMVGNSHRLQQALSRERR